MGKEKIIALFNNIKSAIYFQCGLLNFINIDYENYME